jgi:hypothetical protein
MVVKPLRCTSAAVAEDRRPANLPKGQRRRYAGCIDGHEQLWNRRIDDALMTDPDNAS